MPYRLVTADPTLLRIELVGVITPDDLHRATRELLAFESTLSVMPNRIADLTEAEEREISAHDLMLLAQVRRAQTFPNAFRTAIVAPTDASLGFARMFQILNDHPQIEIGVFRETAEAMRWLGKV